MFEVLLLRDKKQLLRHRKVPEFFTYLSQIRHGGYEIKKNRSKKNLESHLWFLCDPVLLEFLIIMYESEMKVYCTQFAVIFIYRNRLDLIQISIKYYNEYYKESILQYLAYTAAHFQMFQIVKYLHGLRLKQKHEIKRAALLCKLKELQNEQQQPTDLKYIFRFKNLFKITLIWLRCLVIVVKGSIKQKFNSKSLFKILIKHHQQFHQYTSSHLQPSNSHRFDMKLQDQTKNQEHIPL